MEQILSVLAILFTMMFFILGILVKLIMSFREEMRAGMDKADSLFWAHRHDRGGHAYIPREAIAEKGGIQA